MLALAVHRADSAQTWGPFPSGLPWGVALACAASVAGSVGLRAVGVGPPVLAAYGVGWCLVLLTALAGRPEGDYLVGGDTRGSVFLVVGAGSVVVATAVGVATARRSG